MPSSVGSTDNACVSLGLIRKKEGYFSLFGKESASRSRPLDGTYLNNGHRHRAQDWPRLLRLTPWSPLHRLARNCQMYKLQGRLWNWRAVRTDSFVAETQETERLLSLDT